jgi:hypothetical protein
MGCVPVPVVQVVQVVVMGDGPVATLFAVDVVVLGEIVYPMPQRVRHRAIHLSGERR